MIVEIAKEFFKLLESYPLNPRLNGFSRAGVIDFILLMAKPINKSVINIYLQ